MRLEILPKIIKTCYALETSQELYANQLIQSLCFLELTFVIHQIYSQGNEAIK